MGACATKPRDAELESDAPLPMEDSAVSEMKTEEVKLEEEAKIEDTKERRSLSHLFQENEEVKESSEKETENQKESGIPNPIDEQQPKTEYPALTVASSENVEAEEVEAGKVAEPVVAADDSKKEETNPKVVAQKEETPLPVPSATPTEVPSAGVEEKK